MSDCNKSLLRFCLIILNSRCGDKHVAANIQRKTSAYTDRDEEILVVTVEKPGKLRIVMRKF